MGRRCEDTLQGTRAGALAKNRYGSLDRAHGRWYCVREVSLGSWEERQTGIVLMLSRFVLKMG
jgi:hypothetical protein